MKRQLLTGLAAGLFGATSLVALTPASMGTQLASACDQGTCYQQGTSWQDRMQRNGRFTLAGEYLYRRILERQPFDIDNVMFIENGPMVCPIPIAPDERCPVDLVLAPIVQGVLDPFRLHGHGNFGSVFVAYQYRANCEPYLALRARWASGEVERSHSDEDGILVRNQILHFDEVDGTGFRDSFFEWSDRAHEWNVEARLGYTFGLGCQGQFGLTPYLGAGYEGGHMNLHGRQHYRWFYIPVGFVASYQFNPEFSMGLDADFGMMADARYLNLDEPSINNIERMFGNRYRWELELPLTYTFACWNNGHFSMGLVPFWHGWRVREMLQGEESVQADFSSNGFAQTSPIGGGGGRGGPIPFLPQNPDIVENVNEVEVFQDSVVTYDQLVATPRMLNNSWGGRLEFAWQF